MYATQASTAPTTTHNVNGNLATHTNISLTSNDVPVTKPKTSRSTTAGPSSATPVNKTLVKAKEESRAPPLPPRKSSPGVSDKKGGASSSALELDRSTENITILCDLEVPKTVAPPVPKHRVEYVLASDLRLTTISPSPPPPPPPPNPYEADDNEVETIIVGPAETISGIIDTRPLEARRNSTKSTCDGTDKNNVYQIKAPASPSMHTRHQSMSVVNSMPATTKPDEPVVVQHRPKPPAELPPSTSTTKTQPQRPTSTPPTQSNFVYENMTITTDDGACSISGKDCSNGKSGPYENVNTDYITRLMNEGYSKEHVVTALGISRNNIDMALDMLYVYVKKGSSGGAGG